MKNPSINLDSFKNQGNPQIYRVSDILNKKTIARSSEDKIEKTSKAKVVSQFYEFFLFDFLL